MCIDSIYLNFSSGNADRLLMRFMNDETNKKLQLQYKHFIELVCFSYHHHLIQQCNEMMIRILASLDVLNIQLQLKFTCIKYQMIHSD